MKEFQICNLCDQPGSFAQAREKARVYCHVRKFKNDAFTVWRCVNCGCLHSLEPVDLQKYYDDYPFKNHKLDFHTKIAYANRVNLLKQLNVSYKNSIIDYGCGAGLYVEYLKNHSFENTVGYDPFINQYSNDDVLKAKYDVVVSHDVIEHVDNPMQFFETMLSLSKPGGLVVVGTPNASEIKLSGSSFPAVELSQPYHRHILSERALITQAKKFGFDVRHVYRRFYFDSLIPGVNVRFMWKYIAMCGGMIDAAVEPFRWRLVLSSPRLWLLAFFGYFWRSPGNILITFQSKDAIKTSSDQVTTRVANE